MNDVIGGGETSQKNEAVKHSFKNLKTQAKTLISKDIGGRYQLSLLHRRELRDNGTQISQVKESLFWKQKSPIENTLKSDGLVIRLARKENKSIKSYFLFEPTDLGKGKNDMNLKSIIMDNPINKRESYQVDFNADGSIKITRTDDKGVETEISAEQFVYLKEIDAIKNTLSTADDEVKKTVKRASVFAGAALTGLAAGAGITQVIDHFTKLQIPQEPKTPLIEKPKSEYQYDPSLVEKLKQADLSMEKIEEIYGFEIKFTTFSYMLLKAVVENDTKMLDQLNTYNYKEQLKDFLLNKRGAEVKKRLGTNPVLEADKENKNEIMLRDNPDLEVRTGKYLSRLFFSYLKEDRGRIKKILIGSDQNSASGKGILKTTLGAMGANFLFNELQRSFHESVHMTAGIFKELFTQDENHKFIEMNGYTANNTAEQLDDWLSVFANNPDFFNKYFFNIPGDGILTFLKDDGILERGLPEIMAISCTNYFFNERANWMGEDIKKYPDIERAIRRQLAVTFYGGDALTNSPDGVSDEQLALIRKDFGKNYIVGLVEVMSGADDLGETTLKALSGDLNKYYTENTAGYLVADGEPTNEMNKRFIEENNLEAHISTRPMNLQGIQKLNQINEFIVRYGRTFFPDGKIG